MEYLLTITGEEKIYEFIRECKAKRKEILDAGKDTADETTLPTVKDILDDINEGVGIDEDGYYYNSWGVTDNYNSDTPCSLYYGIDFVKENEISISYSNGDIENPVEIPFGKDPYEYIWELALTEMQITGYEAGHIVGDMSLAWDKDGKRIILTYADGSKCYYYCGLKERNEYIWLNYKEI